MSFFLHLKNTFETYFRQNHFVSVTTSTLSDFDVDVHFKPCTRYDPYSLLFFFPLSVWSALSPKEFHRFWCESCVEFPQWELCIFRSNSLERFSQSLPYRQLYIYENNLCKREKLSKISTGLLFKDLHTFGLFWLIYRMSALCKVICFRSLY